VSLADRAGASKPAAVADRAGHCVRKDCAVQLVQHGAHAESESATSGFLLSHARWMSISGLSPRPPCAKPRSAGAKFHKFTRLDATMKYLTSVEHSPVEP
jgi:hypothetical protein